MGCDNMNIIEEVKKYVLEKIEEYKNNGI